jgi:protein O-mannosyl-transferase
MSLSGIDDLRKQPVVLGALLVVVTLLLYLPVVHHEFINGWDDDDYVTGNIHVRSGLTLANVSWAFTSFDMSNWHPVTWLSHMLDCQLFGLNSGAQHYVNVLLHAANVLLLFWILQRSTGAVWRSCVVAALFAVHPLNVETVAWVAQRKSLLSAFFSLLTVAAYGLYIRRGGWQRYPLVAGAFALALMSKPMAVSLPLLLLLFDYWPLKRFEDFPLSRRWTRLALEKLPLLFMSAVSSVLTEMAQRAGGSVMQLTLLPFSTRVENTVISYVGYIGKILWPARLATFYPLEFAPRLGDVMAGAILLIGLSALALYFRRAPYLAMGWFFFLMTLVPVIGIVQVGFQGMADRYAYIPAIGLFIAVTWGLAAVVEQVQMARVALSVAALCLICSLATATEYYLKFWQNGVTLFAQARVAYGRPHMWLEQLYGNALLASGRTGEAFQHYQQSCALDSENQYCHYEMAHILLSWGQFRNAIREYKFALMLTSHNPIKLLCLNESGQAFLALGDYDAAQESIREALRIDPANVEALRLREQISNKGAQ